MFLQQCHTRYLMMPKGVFGCRKALASAPSPGDLTLVWAAKWRPAGTMCACNPPPVQQVWEAEPAHGGRVATSWRLTAREWSGLSLAWGATSGWLSPRAQLLRHSWYFCQAQYISWLCALLFPSLLEVQSLPTHLLLNRLFIVYL